jgi:hypothetical protein
MQKKTQHPVQFEITEQTRTVLKAWMHQAQLRSADSCCPGVFTHSGPKADTHKGFFSDATLFDSILFL